MNNRRNPIPIDATMPLWWIAALRILQRRHAPQRMVFEYEVLKEHLLLLEKLKQSVPEPQGALERLLASAMHRDIDRRIQAMETMIDLKVSTFAVLPAGDPDEVQALIQKLKDEHDQKIDPPPAAE